MQRMEEEDEQQQGTRIPFWLQETAIRQPTEWSSIVFNFTSILILVIVMVGLWINFYIIPKIIYLMHQICNSKSLKRDLESLNMLLVLFAVICGLLTQIAGEPDNPNFHTPTYMSRLSTHKTRGGEEDQILWSRPDTASPATETARTATTIVHAARSISDMEEEIYYDAEALQDFDDEIRPALDPPRSPPPPPHETRRQFVTNAMPPPPSPYARLWAPSAPPLPPPSLLYVRFRGPSAPHIPPAPPSATRGDMTYQRRVGYMKKIISAIRNWIVRPNKKRGPDHTNWLNQISSHQPAPHPNRHGTDCQHGDYFERLRHGLSSDCQLFNRLPPPHEINYGFSWPSCMEETHQG